MSFGMNRVELIGRLGADVTVNHLMSGGRVANLSIATDESYFSKTGEKVDRTEWHRVVTFQDGLIDMLERHAKKGRLVHAEGKLQTRRWKKDGEDNGPFLDRDPDRARSQDPVPRQAEQRERERGRAGAGERRGHAGRQRPGAGRRFGLGPHPVLSPDRLPPSQLGRPLSAVAHFFCCRLRARFRPGLACALRAPRIVLPRRRESEGGR